MTGISPQTPDAILVSAVKTEGDNSAFIEICRRYENIFYKICHRYASALSAVGVCVQDIFNEKDYIIFYCISSYDETKKTKLSTWIGNYARYLCLNSINSKRFVKSPTEEDIRKMNDTPAEDSPCGVHTNTTDDADYITHILKQIKDKRVEKVIRLRYFSGPRKMIWSKIAKQMDISTQTAINLHHRGVKLIRKKMQSARISDVV